MEFRVFLHFWPAKVIDESSGRQKGNVVEFDQSGNRGWKRERMKRVKITNAVSSLFLHKMRI